MSGSICAWQCLLCGAAHAHAAFTGGTAGGTRAIAWGAPRRASTSALRRGAWPASDRLVAALRVLVPVVVDALDALAVDALEHVFLLHGGVEHLVERRG